MNPETRYNDLVEEFEQRLSRKLKPEEREFIRWMVRQEDGDPSEQDLCLVLC